MRAHIFIIGVNANYHQVAAKYHRVAPRTLDTFYPESYDQLNRCKEVQDECILFRNTRIRQPSLKQSQIETIRQFILQFQR